MSPDNLAPNPVGWNLAWAAVVAFLAAAALFSWLDPKKPVIEGLKGNYFSTDQTFRYTPDRLFTMLGEHYDKREYFDAHRYFIKVDFVFALVYAAAGVVVMLYLYGPLAPHVPAWLRYLWLIPLVAGVCDVLEGVSMWRILDAYEGGRPASPPTTLAAFSSAMTSVKLVLMYLLAGLLLVGGIALVFRKFPRA
jgi:hypothetical protein